LLKHLKSLPLSKLTTIAIPLALAFSGLWDVFVPTHVLTKIVGGLCLAIVAIKVLSTKWHGKNKKMQSTFQHNMEQLRAAQSLSERQQIVDHMLVLNQLSQIDMSGIDLSELHLAHADLSSTDLSALRCDRTDLSGAELEQAKLRYATVLYSSFNNTNFQKADLSGTTFRGTDLSYANFQSTNLRATTFHNCDLSNADFRKANLRHADFRQSNLANARLEGADLSFCVLPDGTIWSPETDMSQFRNPENGFNLMEMLFTAKKIEKNEDSHSE